MALNAPFGPCQYCSCLAPYAGYTVNGYPKFECTQGTGCKMPVYSPHASNTRNSIYEDFDTRTIKVYFGAFNFGIIFPWELLENLCSNPGFPIKLEGKTENKNGVIVLSLKVTKETEVVDEIVQKFIEANKKAEEEKD